MNKKDPPGMMTYKEPLIMLLMASDEDAGKTIKAAADYFFRAKMPENLDERCQMIFDIIAEDVDKGRDKYNEVCKRNKANADKRWQNH